MSAIRRSIAVHGFGSTIGIALLLAFIAVVFLSLLGIGVALVLIPAATPLTTLLSAACGLFLIFGALRVIA